MTYKDTANGVFDFSPGCNLKKFQPEIKFQPGLNFNSSTCNSPLRVGIFKKIIFCKANTKEKLA